MYNIESHKYIERIINSSSDILFVEIAGFYSFCDNFVRHFGIGCSPLFTDFITNILKNYISFEIKNKFFSVGNLFSKIFYKKLLSNLSNRRFCKKTKPSKDNKKINLLDKIRIFIAANLFLSRGNFVAAVYAEYLDYNYISSSIISIF